MVMNKGGINIETATTDDIAQFLGVLFNILADPKDDKERDDTCLYIGKLMFGLVLVNRISFSITEPVKIKNKKPQDVNPKFH